ncbi:site-specific integrase [Cellulomonas sp. Root485]|uniref:site-specific integrase n=1 Tax=Cellulomonas sp. Root485 TaxID=1736546 RepID=UPI0012FCA1E9|nr:site-specific integrase [Cellulomonas sp. Root485]
MTVLSRFVAWAHGEGLPLDREVMLTPDQVDRYTKVGCDAFRLESRATIRSEMRRYSRELTRRAPWPELDRIGKRSGPVPYTRAEIARLWEVAGQQSTAVRRRHLTVILGLGLGAGVHPGEIGHVTTNDLITVSGVWCVRLVGDRPRTVPITAPYQEPLLAIAAEDPGSRLIGKVESEWVSSRLSRMLEKAEFPEDCPRLTTYRLRVTWLVAHLDHDVNLRGLAEMAAVSSASAFEKAIAHMRPTDVHQLIESMARR